MQHCTASRAYKAQQLTATVCIDLASDGEAACRSEVLHLEAKQTQHLVRASSQPSPFFFASFGKTQTLISVGGVHVLHVFQAAAEGPKRSKGKQNHWGIKHVDFQLILVSSSPATDCLNEHIDGFRLECLRSMSILNSCLFARNRAITESGQAGGPWHRGCPSFWS